jgi:hypothetical protein
MPPLENNYEEWKEIRARTDSIANAIFLIAGGALSLSITVMLSNKSNGTITPEVAQQATTAWYWLLSSIILSLVVKVAMVLQAFLLQFKTEFINTHLNKFNSLSWVFGLSGLFAFSCGFIKMVYAAVLAVSV